MDPSACRLCGAALPDEPGSRCPNCGLYSATDTGRVLYVRVAAGLAALYGLTSLVVLITR